MLRRISTNGQKNKDLHIAQLSKNLFDKIDTVKTEAQSSKQIASHNQISIKMNSQFDSLNKLLQKAQYITKNNFDTIEGAKKKKLSQRVDGEGTFLTGTGQYEEQRELLLKRTNMIMDKDPESEHDILKQLIQKQQKDDLAELRRMIKETDQNLNECHRKVSKTHKNIINFIGDKNQGWKGKSQSTKAFKIRFR